MPKRIKQDRIEEVKKILEQLIALDYINMTSGQPHSMVEDISRTTQQIDDYYSQLFTQPLEEEVLEITKQAHLDMYGDIGSKP